MPWLAGARRCFFFCDRARRCFCCVPDDPEIQDFARRAVLVDSHRDDVIYRVFPPSRISRFFEFERAIGSGGYGTVFRGKPTAEALRTISRLDHGISYAVKRVKRSPKGLSEDIARSLLSNTLERHIEFLDWIRKPDASQAHIVRIYAFVAEIPRNIYHIMECLEGPDLFDFVSARSSTLPESLAAQISQQIFLAIHHMHWKVGALHRDIKPENFGFVRQVPAEGSSLPMPPLKLFDFGLTWVLPAPVCEETSHKMLKLTRAGTPMYMAPEVWGGSGGPPSDVWAAGLILYLLMSLDLPFQLLNARHSLTAVQENSLKFEAGTWSSVSMPCQHLISLILQKDPQSRASTQAVLANSWFRTPGTAPALTRSTSNRMPCRSRVEGDTAIWHTVASVSGRM